MSVDTLAIGGMAVLLDVQCTRQLINKQSSDVNVGDDWACATVASLEMVQRGLGYGDISMSHVDAFRMGKCGWVLAGQRARPL
jgi:hypothetical protein